MVREFLSWWLRQLLGLLPARWRQSRSGMEARDAVLLLLQEPAQARPATVELMLRRQGRGGRLGRFLLDGSGLQALRAAAGSPARRGAVRLVLPAHLLLEQQVTLPLAAERELDSVLRYEMDRLTPFRPDAVFWSRIVERRDRQNGRVQIRLRLVPKVMIGAVLEALATVGLTPALLESAADPARQIALAAPHASPWRQRSWAVAGAVCAALLLATIAIPFVQQSLQAGRVEARIEALRPQVDLAEALRRRLTDQAASADIVAAEGARVGDALRALSDVTDVLPDDTYLYELTLRDRILTLSGQSAAAARLIPTLAADPALRNPTFSAPITRNELTGSEGFSIRAETVP